MTRLLSILLALSCGASSAAATPAFPGAQGYGALAEGGRGGAVYAVTDLSDDPASPAVGTLRWAIQQPGPRTVVFRKGGTIELEAPLVVSNPYLTIAGQTAPGGGIALKAAPAAAVPSLISVAADHVIVRHVRLRPGPYPTPANRAAFQIGSAAIPEPVNDVIVDHVSVSWGWDDMVVVHWNATNVTVQHSIIAEGLLDPYADSVRSQGLLVYGNSPNSPPFPPSDSQVSIHHNLFAHTQKRVPKIAGASGDFEIVNNVMFDFRTDQYSTRIDRGNPLHGSASVAARLIGNRFVVPAVLLPFDPFWREITLVNPDFPDLPPADVQAYLSENLGASNETDPGDQMLLLSTKGGGSAPFVVPADPVALAPIPISVQTAQAAYDTVLAGAGATRPARDAADLRIVADVHANAHGWVQAHPDEVGGWPVLADGTPYADADGDGMADPWESSWQLDPANPADRNGDPDGDGYTNLEEFLNQTKPRPGGCGMGGEIALVLVPLMRLRFRR